MNKQNTFELKIVGNKQCFGYLEVLNTFRFSNNRRFPTSYISFVKQYGYGLTANNFHIYIPLDTYGDSLFIRTNEIRSTYFSDIINGDIWFDIDPNVTPTILRNLYPFASSDNGEYLFWDINSSDDNSEEMDIYITDFRGIELKKVASNLYEFIFKITNANSYKEIMPFATKPLPSVFKAYTLNNTILNG